MKSLKGKFELVDKGKDNYILVGYRSLVFAIDIFLQIVFNGDDDCEQNIDSGYGSSERHDTVVMQCATAIGFSIEDIYKDGEKIELNLDNLKKINAEAAENFGYFFKGEEYDDIVASLTTYEEGGVLRLIHSTINSGKSEDVDIEGVFSNPQRFIDYDGRFLYPPRIEHKLQPSSLFKFDDNNYVGQPKFNGASSSVTISEMTAIAKERHNTFFAIPPTFNFKDMHRGRGFMCLTGEFMNKSKKDENGQPFRGFCIWDILAFDNKILIGSSIEERLELLKRIYPSYGELKTKEGTPYLFKTSEPFIFRSANFYSNFSKVYEDLSAVDMLEGFALKRKSGRLEMMRVEKNNTGWSCKVRKPTKNYES
jgi:hypothetical protein